MGMVFQLFVGLVLAGFGAVYAHGSFKTYRITKRRHTFEPVTATIVNAELRERTTSSGSPNDPGGSSKKYRAEITYEYTVGGETYENDDLYPGSIESWDRSKDDQQEIVNSYPHGESVEAFYDPSDPAVSFLENESQKGQAVFTGILGGIFLLLGLAVIVFTPL